MMKRFYPLCIALGVAAGAFFFLQYAYPYHLFYREQVSLFLWSTEYLESFAGQPAAVGCWLGEWLTQFFYYIAMGPLIIALLLGILFLLTRQALCRLVGEPWGTLAGVAASLWEFSRNLFLNYPTGSTVCLIGGIGMGSLLLRFILPEPSRRQHSRTTAAIRAIIATLGGALSVLLFGYGGWATVLILLGAAIRKRDYSPLTGLAGSALMTYLLWLHLPVTARQALTYPANSWGGKPEWEMEERLAVDCEYYFGHYDKALELIEQCQHPKNPVMIYYRNLLHALRGDLPEHLLTTPQIQAPLLPVPKPGRTASEIFTMSEGWWAAGDATMTEHAAILGQIFSPRHRSSRMTRRLAEVNLQNGDKEAAMKYLRLLESTCCHRKWARRTEVRSYPAVPEVTDTLRLSGDVERSLHQALKIHPENQAALDFLLCQLLLQKRTVEFEQVYRRYVLSQSNRITHRLYQEALLVALASQNRLNPQTAQELHLSHSLIREFQNYTETYEKSGGRFNALQPQYGNTYWFFCHFAKFK